MAGLTKITSSEGGTKIQQSQEDIHVKFIILITIFLFLSLFLYISYHQYTEKRYPIYMSNNNFDLMVNQNKLNSVQTSTTLNGKVVTSYDKINSYTNVNFCNQGKCAVNFESGVKRCPDGSNRITYDIESEVCVEKNKCPASLPYAIRSDGEAISNTCQDGEICYCTRQPQCATKVVKYFETKNGKPGSDEKLSYAFSTTGDKGNNIYSNLTLDSESYGSTQFCKINPAYTDNIAHGCDFTNRINFPLDCKNTGILFNSSFASSPSTGLSVLKIYDGMTKFNMPFFDFGSFPFNRAYDEIFGNTVTPLVDAIFIELKDTNFGIGRTSGMVKLGTSQINFTHTEKYKNLLKLSGLSYLNDGVFKKINFTTDTERCYIENLSIGYCHDSTDKLDNNNWNVNFKNMLTCVQPTNQPCTEGTLAYNVDTKPARQFCQGSGVSLDISQDSNIKDFFLIDPSYFTMSCVAGEGCDDAIDTSLCLSEDDCTNAFERKKEKLYPNIDYSALTNRIVIPPPVYNLPFVGNIEYNTNINKFSLKNNFIPLESGDYWQVTNTEVIIRLGSSSAAGTNILNVNTTVGLSVGMNINLSSGAGHTIESINGLSVGVNPVLTGIDAANTFKNRAIYAYNYDDNEDKFGIVKGVSNLFNEQTFILEKLNSTSTLQSLGGIEYGGIIFYKQFGFNGINYNTKYSGTSRVYVDSYKSGITRYQTNLESTMNKPPFTFNQILPQNTNNTQYTLLHENANFKQNLSMYYPVWNDDYFRQECIHCSPSLNAEVIVGDDNSGPIVGTNVQFSSQDFFHYVPDNSETNTFYRHISFGLTDVSINRSDKHSTSSCIILRSPIANLKPGDYIMDEDGIINSGALENFTSNKNLILEDDYYRDDAHSHFVLNGKKIVPSSSTNNNRDNKNFFYGKIYKDTNTNLYHTIDLNKINKIRSISSDGLKIFTTNYSLIPIDSKKIIQFISSTEIMEFQGLTDLNDNSKARGSGLVLYPESIYDGRIISLKIINRGSGYSPDNLPLITLKKYQPNNSVFTMSRKKT